MTWLLWLVEGLAVAAFARYLDLGWWVWILYGGCAVLEVGALHRYFNRSSKVTLDCPFVVSQQQPPVRIVP